MSFSEYWKEQQAQEAAQLQRQVEAAGCWIGRRVWIASSGGMGSRQPIYGEVVSIDASGSVKIVVGYGRNDQPMYHGVHVSHLGGVVTLADA